MLLDGQVFTHAVFGIVCGVVAVGCGIMAALGFALGVWCIVLLPSAYRSQDKFNGRREQRQQMKEQSRTANLIAATGDSRQFMSGQCKPTRLRHLRWALGVISQ